MSDDAGNELEFISDGDGLAVIGPSSAVERFIAHAGLPSRELDLHRLTPLLSKGSAAANTASEIAANSGRWMKLTEESARVAQSANLVQRGGDVVQATTRSANGQFAKNLQFVAKPGAMLTNPAILAGAAGIMAQVAMQQTMEEITDYLAKIDAKIDDVLRAQKDAVFADMLGVQLLLDEAMAVRAEVGRVSEVTWSKVQATAGTIARTQAYALRQLDALAEKLERTTKVADLADLSKDAQETVAEWLGVLARCFHLQEASAILEIDRVFDTSPEELDRHRVGLQTARQRRRELISQTTAQLILRMDAAAHRANAKVLTNPLTSRVVVQARNEVELNVAGLREALGIADELRLLEARRWSEAAAETRDDVFGAGVAGLQTAGRIGSEAFVNARTSTGRLTGKITGRLHRASEQPEPENTAATLPHTPEES